LAPTAGALLLGMALFCGPLWMRNFRAYGHFSVPEKALLDHYGPPRPLAARAEKLALNLHAAVAQACDPHSQPPWLRAPVERLGRALIASLPVHDPYTFESVDRPGTLRLYFDSAEPDSDFLTPGVLVLLLAGAAWVVAAGPGDRRGRGLVITWGAGVGVYFLVQNALFEWHPWAFRYTALVAPWLALSAVWLLAQLPRVGRIAGWTLLLAGGAWNGAEAYFFGTHTAWHGAKFTLLTEKGDWRDWAETFEPASSAVRVALPVNAPTSQFFRLKRTGPTTLEALSALPDRSAEEIAAGQGGGWLVAPALRFLGREGRVAMKTWIQRGDPRDRLSLAAYRPLQPGETPTPALYADLGETMPNGFARILVFRSWEETNSVLVANPSGNTWRLELEDRGTRVTGTIGPRSVGALPVGAAVDTVTQVRLVFTLPEGTPSDGRVPFVQGIRAGAPEGR
jgi:hypothetical protein